MLDRIKVLSQLQQLGDSLFQDISAEYAIARESFERICADPDFQEKTKQINCPWILPSWQGPLDALFKINSEVGNYAVLGVDGSQIYPDRHQGTGCFLINIGSVLIEYGAQSRVQLQSSPYIFAHDHDIDAATPDIINCKRQELEFQIGLERAREYASMHADRKVFFLFDGSLIFWHLESKDTALKEKYIATYIAALHELYKSEIPCAGYISLPKSKELVNLLRVELCGFKIEGCTKHTAVDSIVDSTIARFFLTYGTRTTLFKSNATIGQFYPEHLKPYFLYMDIGQEIVRIEFPAWMAQNASLMEKVCAVIFNQAIKGAGYPVAIAEAHEQAVVKGPDRDFFYHALTKMAIDQRQHISMSQKSMKKRGLGV